MSLPSEHELKGAILRLLTRARDEGRLDQLTVRIVLRELAAYYNVGEDAFQGEDYKPFIKATVHETIRSFEDASGGDAGTTRHKERKKERSEKAKAGKRKRRSGLGEDADVSESEAPSSHKASSRSKPSKARNDLVADKPAKSSKASKKPESELKYKSKAIIETSDDEAAPESGTRSKKEATPRKSSPLKQRQQKADKDDSDVEMDTGEGPGPSSSSSKPKSVTESSGPSTSKVKESTKDPMESELSSVIDEPPTKRKKKQEKAPAKPQKDEKMKRGKKKEPLSKDEETVNKLKGIVLACGVRKAWKKEFEGLDKPSQQINRLHSILSDLGMAPRYSLEKAKAIREERELAQELKDVQEFDRATKKRGKALRSSSETAESGNEDASDTNVPAQKKQNARASIMAFLQDQSEEE